MRALVVDHSAPAHLRLAEAPDPRPAANQALVEVRAFSLNYGELAGLPNQPEGTVPGWDAAGVVVAAAADGTGPAEGSRVVTFGPAGAWAGLRAVDTTELAVVPDEVELGTTSALPVAGVTALRAIRRFGFVGGERILVTGASGGVGRFAVQIAALAGAHVIASVGRPERGAGLAELGADEVVVGLDTVAGPLHGVVDNVGGPHLVKAFGLLGEGGSLQSIGATSGEPAVFPPYATVGTHRRLEAFTMGGNLARDLGYLVNLAARGRLDIQVGWRGTWEHTAEAVEALFGRQVAGKAVLDVT
ncbi:zinc-binding dehydrogenase [Actinopolymorpha sp. NPDC004070]|uniref:zinc-binding dehydrogenase n=1 Tax=Actinopolymorpha sp. NPDC004070 TaxID=3154548 RepID=UPI0033BF83DD